MRQRVFQRVFRKAKRPMDSKMKSLSKVVFTPKLSAFMETDAESKGKGNISRTEDSISTRALLRKPHTAISALETSFAPIARPEQDTQIARLEKKMGKIETLLKYTVGSLKVRGRVSFFFSFLKIQPLTNND